MPTRSACQWRAAPVLLASSVCGVLAAQEVPPPPSVAPLSPAAAAAMPFVDVAPDGVVWARGADWKASFAAAGVQFVPFLGSDAPRNFPLTLQLVEARAGGDAIALDPTPAVTTEPEANGTGIAIARGGCREVYHLTRNHVEQTFEFAAAPRTGPLQVRMRLATELAPTPHPDGSLTFANARGGVRYGRAAAFDARGRRSEVASSLDGETLTLTVPAAFVAAAAFPLVVDPLVATFVVAPGVNSPSLLEADSAHVGTFTGLTAVVHEEAFSLSDHDVFVTGYESDGSIGASIYVDYTTNNWYQPRIASHRGASQFLVVASRSGLLGPSTWGRTLTYAHAGTTTLTPSAQFFVATGNGRHPDVGGDPNPNPPLPGNYCVTWEGATNGAIYCNIVHTDTTVGTPAGVMLHPGPEYASHPTISKSCGVGAYSTREWIIAWQKRYSPVDEDIHGSRVAIDGTVLTADFPIDTSSQSETNPEVSSLTDLIGGVERFVVVYERTIPPIGPLPMHQQIFGQVFAGATSLSAEVNLSQLLGTDPLGDQLNPSVDTDGTRFVVGFSEDPAILNQDIVPYVATLHVINDTFNYTELPVALSGYAGRDEFVRVASERSGGTFTPRYVATWQTTALATGATTVNGAYYMGHLALGPTSYFAEQFPSCGASTLVASGLPALASTFWVDLGGAQGIPAILFGIAIAPTNYCPSCQLGVDPTAMSAILGTHLTITVPQQAWVIGLQFGVQGLDLLAPNGCTSPLAFTLSNMILVTLL
ncbi:MAG: hypothetical protein U1E73_11185 [Planctomycetota bacterium]